MAKMDLSSGRVPHACLICAPSRDAALAEARRMAAAALCHGAVFNGTRRLRFKESDRGAAMAEEMAKFGFSLRLEENRIAVPAGNPHAPHSPLSSHNDHRIAMALSLLCSRTGGEIEGAAAVRKSFPDYWSRLQSLGIPVTLEE